MPVSLQWLRRLIPVVVVVLSLWPTAAARADECCDISVSMGETVLSPDGSFLYVTNVRGQIWVLARDWRTGAVRTVGDASGRGPSLTMSPDGAFLYSGGVVFRRDRDTGRLTETGRDFLDPFGRWDLDDLQLSADGRFGYMTTSGGGESELTVLSRDPRSGALTPISIRRVGFHEHRSLLLAGAGGEWLYALGQGLTTFRRDPATGALSQVARRDDYGTDLAAPPDASRVYAGAGTAYTRDPGTGGLEPLAVPGFLPGHQLADGTMATSPDGGLLYATSDSNRLSVYATSGSSLARRTLYDDGDAGGFVGAGGVTVSPDGRFVYLAGGGARERDPSGLTVLRPAPDGGVTPLSRWHVPVHSDAPQGPPSVSINEGARYTNDPNVTLRLQGGGFYLVDNDGAFGSGRTYSTPEGGGTVPWTLARTGPERLPKTVYVRVFPHLRPSQIVTDDIVLDEIAPKVLGATLARRASRGRSVRRVRIRARDNASGVHRLQLTRTRARPGAWRRYRASVAPPRGRRAMWLRVRDRAGNRSKWRRVRPARQRR